MPGAINLPLFSDAERALVGTTYKREGRDAAVLEGLRHVGPRMAAMVEHAWAVAPSGRIRVHCWRGGERSGSVAWLLAKAGFNEVITLAGGYKSFRRKVIGDLDIVPELRVLGGFTGTGKTEILARLKEEGEQTIDLEALASHKGSAFGGLGLQAQPSTEQFENRLWRALTSLDPARPIWVEDESLMIGKVKIPTAFFEQMRNATLFFIERPLEQRVARLVAEYGERPGEELAAAVGRIRKRLGPQHCKAALEALEQRDLHLVAGIVLNYYDKAYRRGLEQRDPTRIIHIPAIENCMKEDIKALMSHVAAIH